jgi:hypothetical protein
MSAIQLELEPVTLNCNDYSEPSKKLVQTACDRLGIEDAVLRNNLLKIPSLQLEVEFSWFPLGNFPEEIIEKIEKRVYDVRKLEAIEEPLKIVEKTTKTPETSKTTVLDAKLPASAKAKWIGLVPSLGFKIVGYETEHVSYVLVSGQGLDAQVFKNVNNKGVKKAFEVVGLSTAYAEAFNRTAPYEFVRKMLNAASFKEGFVGKACYIFETL